MGVHSDVFRLVFVLYVIGRNTHRQIDTVGAFFVGAKVPCCERSPAYNRLTMTVFWVTWIYWVVENKFVALIDTPPVHNAIAPLDVQ